MKEQEIIEFIKDMSYMSSFYARVYENISDEGLKRLAEHEFDGEYELMHFLESCDPNLFY